VLCNLLVLLSSNMTIRLSVYRLTGELVVVSMLRHSTIADLKVYLQTITGIRPRRQRILYGTDIADDALKLRKLALPIWPDWCIITDMATLPSYIHRELELTLVVDGCTCTFCSKVEMSMRVCPRCSAHYCSSVCQSSDWVAHKQICIR